MRKLLLALLLAVIAPTLARATTRTALSCGETDVQTTVNASVTGDIVQIPGNCTTTWATFVTISGSQGITIQPVPGTTVIIGTASQGFQLTQGSSTTRITGFTCYNAGSASDSNGHCLQVVSTPGGATWRMDHWTFCGGGGACITGNAIFISITGTGPGLIDHNNFTANGAAWIQEYADGPSSTAGWSDDIVPGGPNMLFIETNTFTNAICNATTQGCQAQNSGGWIQAYYGARNVIRYNTFTMTTIDQHGSAGGGNECPGGGSLCVGAIGTRWYEIYNNNFIGIAGTNPGANPNQWFRYIDLRAGAGVVYNNSFSPNGVGYASNQLGIGIREENTCAWPNSYQIGAGINGFSATCTPEYTPCSSTLNTAPTHFWGNTGTFSIYPAGTVQQGRDYFLDSSQPASIHWKEAAGDTCSTTYAYAPYSYPHPLAVPTTIYVNRDSACPGSGTLAAPYCTIQNAFNVAVAGDDIRIQKASVPYDENAIAQSSGTSVNPITVESDDPTNQAIIRYTGSGANVAAIEILDKSYWTIQNLTFDGTGVFTSTMALWVGISNTARWTSGPALTGFQILNNTFKNWGGSESQQAGIPGTPGTMALNVSGGYGPPVGGFTINGTIVQGNLFDTNRMIAISMTSTRNSVVQSNEIKNTTCGMQLSGGGGTAVVVDGMHLITGTTNFVTGDVFKNNLIHDHQDPSLCGLTPSGGGSYYEWDGIHSDVYPNGGTINANRIWNIDPNNFRNGESTGLHIEAGSFGWIVTNNIIYNVGYDGILNNQQTGSGTVNKYYNNTIYSSGTATGNQVGIELRYGFATVENNIISTPDLPIYVRSGAVSAGGLTIDYNDYSGTNVGSWNEGGITNFATWKTNCSCDAHSINADPLFTNATGSVFTLQSSSPAINAGNPSSIPGTTDYAGNPREINGRIDIGAYETPPTVHTAASCSEADVQAAIDISLNGDTVLVPASSCPGGVTWNPSTSSTNTGPVHLTSSHQITLDGQGVTVVFGANGTDPGFENTVISVVTGTSNAPGTGTVANTVIQNFKFVGGYTNRFPITIISAPGNKTWRLTGNTFSGINGTVIGVYGAGGSAGLIDHNTFIATLNFAEIIHNFGSVDSNGNAGNQTNDWSSDVIPGSLNLLDIETNSFTGPVATPSEGTEAVETYDGGRVLFRYNVLNNVDFDAHGDTSALVAPCTQVNTRWYEVYNNQWATSGNDIPTINVRGGSGVIWGNTHPNAGAKIQLQADCSSTSSGVPYPYQDQDGYGITISSGSSATHQSPIYIWNNDANFSIGTASHDNLGTTYIQLNRDYFVSASQPGTIQRCESAADVTAGCPVSYAYSPAVYPNPLVGGGGSPILSLSPSPAAFGNQAVGTTSGTLTVTVSNTGNVSQVMATPYFTITGANASNFTNAGTGSCVNGGTVAVSSSCTVNLTFTPPTTGALTATLNIQGTVSASDSLTGTGVAPVISISPSPVAFGNQAVGTTSGATTVTVSNTGTSAETLASPFFSLTGTNPSDFARSGGTCSNGGTIAGSAITLVQSATKDASGVTSTTIPFTSSNTGGNWIGVVVREGAAADTLTVTDSIGNTYHKAVQFNQTTDGDTNAIFYAENVAAGVNTVNVAGTLSATYRVVIMEFAGVATSSSLDVTSAGQGTSTSPNSGSATTTAANELLIGGVMVAGTTTFTPGAGYTTVQIVPAAPNSKLIAEYQLQSAIASVSAGASLSASDLWAAGLATFKAAGNSCTILLTFTPGAIGSRTANLNILGTVNALASVTGTGTQAVVSLSPTSIAFGNQTTGTSSGNRAVTLTNTGNATLGITSITLTGANAAEFSTNGSTCGSTLAASASCSINVVFSPVSVASKTANLTYTTTGAASSPTNVPLTGAGVAPAVPVLSFSPSPAAFGNQNVATTSATTTITVSNTGTATEVLATPYFTITGPNAGAFANVGGGTCANGGSIAASASCTVKIAFTPAATGAMSAVLTINGTVSATDSLTGTGVQPVIGILPSPASFGNQPIGTTSSPLTLTVSNTGTSSEVLNTPYFTITGTNAADFANAGTGSCANGGTIATSGSCTVNLTVTPAGQGARVAQFNLSGTVNASVTLTANGTQALVSLSPTSIAFANQNTGTSSGNQTVTLTNTGNATLTISSIALTGTNANQFSTNGSTCGGTLAASANCTINVVFAPTTNGAKVAALTYTTSAASSPNNVALTGTGVTPGTPSLSFSPSPAAFGNQTTGTTSAPMTITVSNVGTSSEVLATPYWTLTGANPTNFTNTGAGTCANGGTIAASASCTVVLTFSPGATGALSAVLTVNGTVSATDSLTGTGITTSGVTLSPTSINFGNQSAGTVSGPTNVRLTNTGASTLTITSILVTGSNSTEFSINTSTCGATLPASAFCTWNVVFQPATAGSKTAAVTVTTNAASSPDTVSLSGTGTAPITPTTPAPAITIVDALPPGSSLLAEPSAVTPRNFLVSSTGCSSDGVTYSNPCIFTIKCGNCSSTTQVSFNGSPVPQTFASGILTVSVPLALIPIPKVQTDYQFEVLNN